MSLPLAISQLPNDHPNHSSLPIHLHNSKLQPISTQPQSTSTPSIHLQNTKKNTSTYNNLMIAHIKNDQVEDAQAVFDYMPERDEVSWSIIISAYTRFGNYSHAIHLFRKLMWEGLRPNEFVVECILNASLELRDVHIGRQLHGWLVRSGTGLVVSVRTSLMTMYSSCGLLDEARRVFDEAPLSLLNDASLWNSIINVYVMRESWNEAFGLFSKMTSTGIVVLTERFCAFIINACSNARAEKYGKILHGRVIKDGMFDETLIGNSLITVYAKCGNIEEANQLFHRMPRKDVVSWNAVIAGNEQNGEYEIALKLFRKMLKLGQWLQPNRITFLGVLSAISGTSALIYGREVHSHIIRSGLECNTSIANSLITMYSRCKEVEKAELVFEMVPFKDIVSWNSILNMYAKNNCVADAEKTFRVMKDKDSYTWNAMIDAYSQSGNFYEAVRTFLEMHEHGLPFDCMTFSVVLTACSKMVSFHLGKQFHAFVVKLVGHPRFASPIPLLSVHNALLSMYAKCGSISDADRVFIRMKNKDVFSWTAMITGYAHHGVAIKSFELFEKMKQDNVKPNAVTFLGLLTACAHAGLVEEGIHYFRSMSQDHGLDPGTEHYACLVDLFGRLGQLDRAEKMVEAGNTHFKENHADCLNLRKVLLGACHAHKQFDLGVHTAMKILQSEPEDETTHVLLFNLYAASGMWEDAMKVRRWMKDKGLKKEEMGCSWIEAGNRRHLFVAGDISHPQRKEIYVKLEEVNRRCRQMGYVPMTECVLHDVDESQKEMIVGYHSEKLAVSFGLLQSGTGCKGVIRVMKNLRICGDCHNWMKFSSRLERREIVVRDSRRFHFFKDGSCSCGDYW